MKPQVSLGKPLTDTQLAELHTTRDEWMHLGLSTDRCDRPRAEAAVRAAYTATGLAEPPLIIWMDSPLGGLFAAAVVKDLLSKGAGQLYGQLRDQLYGQLRDQLYGQLGDQLRGQLGDQLYGQLGGQLHGQLGGQLGDQLYGQLGDQLGAQLHGQLGGQLRDQLRGQLGDQLRGQLGGQLYGQLGGQLGREISLWRDCYWLAYYTCALPLAGLENSPRLDALAEACLHTGWWWPMRGAVIMTDRPTVLKRDDQGRFHSDAGPALAYADGYTLHAWRGTTVPAWVIEEPDAERALKERNSEIRRAALEVFGLEKMVEHLGLKPVHSCRDFANSGNKLQLYELPRDFYDTPVNLLVMTNASPDLDGRTRRYGETVPATIRRADEAAAWQSDVPVEVYRKLARCT